jgi:hypothetical protein
MNLAARVAFETYGPILYPTPGGRRLRIGTGVVSGDMSFVFHFRDASEDLPLDVVACEFRLADKDGRVWSTTSRFTSALFVTHMFDASASEPMNLFRPNEADDEYRAAFDSHAALSAIRFSSDDRFVRTIAVGDRMIPVQFKYTTIVFDLAIVQDDDELPLLTKLAVKIRSGSLFDTDGQDLGDLGYYMSCSHPLRNNTAASEDGERPWGDNSIPEPMTFTPTELSAAPNEDVEIVA